MPHSGRTLLVHLLGTNDILRKMGADPQVAVAGLFHSVYGTQNFKRAVLTLSDRALVRDVIGERAERLAFLFCEAARPIEAARADDGYRIAAWSGGSELVTAQELRDLQWIDVANAMEQRFAATRSGTGSPERRRASASEPASPSLPSAPESPAPATELPPG